ncbi:MAG: hypothetical protein E7172_03290 [Firmicutes bacterium]|nr:hypothetical protein [Bacillota bacterium]
MKILTLTNIICFNIDINNIGDLMKIISKEDIKKTLIKSFNYDNSELNDREKLYYDNQINKLIVDIYDPNQTEIRFLSANDSYFLRQLLGIIDNGIYLTRDRIIKELGITEYELVSKKNKILKCLGQDILYGYNNSFNNFNHNINLSSSIEDLDLSLKCFCLLNRLGINSLNDLISMSEIDLINLRESDAVSFYEMKSKIDSLGISFIEKDALNIILLSEDITYLHLPDYNYLEILYLNGIKKIGDLVTKSESEIFNLRRMTPIAFSEIKNKVLNLGLSFAETKNCIQDNNGYNQIINFEENDFSRR